MGALIYAASGGVTQTRYVGAGTAWASKSRVPELFGFADGAAIDSVTVWWPSGIKDVMRHVPVNRTLVLTEDEVVPVLPEEPVPFAIRLSPASPNPFTAATTLVLELSGETAAPVRVEVFDLSGRRVCTVIDRDLAPGSFVAGWDGRDDRGRATAPGVYFYRLTAPGVAATRKLVRLAGN
jgi:hypothetical protein